MIRRLIGVSALVLAGLVVAATPAWAHPLGNFSINQYSQVTAGSDAIRVHYVVDMAEIPAFTELQSIHPAADGVVSPAEGAAYVTRQAKALVGGLRLTLDGSTVPLRLTGSRLDLPMGQGGMRTLRITLDLEAPAAGRRPSSLAYASANFAERVGWREIVLQAGPGVFLRSSTASGKDRSRELRAYPQDMLSSPLDVREARATLGYGAGASAPAAVKSPLSSSPLVPDRFATLIATDQLTPTVAATALLLALVLGAAHALTPGHGKTIVAAYLVGARGTAKHAVVLGVTTTLTHTSGVFALGFVMLWVSRAVVPERLYPWLELASGLIVVVIGIVLLTRRLAELRKGRAVAHAHGHDDHELAHTHDDPHTHGPGGHTHVPQDGQSITWKGLIALGISGGLLPCPSALVVLLGAIALHRVAFGLLLILAFSIGLAAVLTGVGLMLVYARRAFERFPVDGRVLRALPVGSALVVTVAGLVIVAGALAQAGLLRG